ncbi:Pentapeptide repeat-containing protein [Chitinophaga jiangningensis]|uniref:Pentapeptide repeat-containing protein n=1 Tax=Chitinophaga jiangningensis TaxID=1419482 RepID=A0A1M7FJ03_9BACT|nr:Pentapeptide repeat-containing protein [Chitinophaga jiangningensis]
MTQTAFFESYNNGQRYFVDLYFEDIEGFTNRDYSGCIFERCFLHIDCSNSNFTNAKFIDSNIKCLDLSNCNLTNALIKNCCVECTIFDHAIIEGFKFENNGYYGAVAEQRHFKEHFYNRKN